jgi:hypothetical protein
MRRLPSWIIQMNKPTSQQLIAYKLKIASQLADSLALSSDSHAVRKGLRLIADTAFDAALEVRNLDSSEIPLRQVLEMHARRPAHSLIRS